LKSENKVFAVLLKKIKAKTYKRIEFIPYVGTNTSYGTRFLATENCFVYYVLGSAARFEFFQN